jgi:hypothetical protein
MEYESVTQNVLIGNTVLSPLSYFIFSQQFYFVICSLWIMGHENPDNNLESQTKQYSINNTTWFYSGMTSW